MNDKPAENGKDFIKTESDDDLPLNKALKFFKMNVCMSYKNTAVWKNWCFKRN